MKVLRCTSDTHVDIPELNITIEPGQTFMCPVGLVDIIVARGGFEVEED